jgi:tetratricopeptide (TPR) repeat protein
LRISALRARARAQSELAEYTAMVRSLLEAQSLNRDMGDPKQELLILSTLGMAYGKLGIRAEAIASHEAALSLSARYAPEYESECYGNLGITLVNCERATEALAYMRQALVLAEQSPDETNKLRARVNLNAVRAAAAEIRQRRGDGEAAREELRSILADCESVLEDCRAAHADAFVMPVIQHIGIVHKCLGDFAVARARFAYVHGDGARARLEAAGNRRAAARRRDRGAIRRLAVAEEALTRALGYYEAAQYKTSILEAHLELARLYEANGRVRARIRRDEEALPDPARDGGQRRDPARAGACVARRVRRDAAAGARGAGGRGLARRPECACWPSAIARSTTRRGTTRSPVSPTAATATNGSMSSSASMSHRTARWRWQSSTSITSSRSTTGIRMFRGTWCCARWPICSRRRAAIRISPSASAATSS